jgi:plasmid stability protein
MGTMVPTTLLMDEDDKSKLRIEAARRSISMGALVRSIISEKLNDPSFFDMSAQRDTQSAQRGADYQSSVPGR